MSKLRCAGAVLLVLLMAACGAEPLAESIVGEWASSDGARYLQYSDDGKFVTELKGETYQGTYELVTGTKIQMVYTDLGVSEVSGIELSGEDLTLTIDGKPTTYQRVQGKRRTPVVENGEGIDSESASGQPADKEPAIDPQSLVGQELKRAMEAFGPVISAKPGDSAGSMLVEFSDYEVYLSDSKIVTSVSPK